MPFSVVKSDNSVEDIVYRQIKISGSKIYEVYLGEDLLGQLHHQRNSWTAIIMYDGFDSNTALRMVEGFSTRYDGVAYMLYALGFWRRYSIHTQDPCVP